MITEENIRNQALLDIATKMVIAARTAPKARGKDLLTAAIVQADEIKLISDRMLEIAKNIEHPGFLRDGQNILAAPVMVLLGSQLESMKLKKCGMCGFPDCQEKDKHPLIPCAFNAGDLGIAVGSAVRVAMDHCVDNRIMYTVGQAVMDLGMFGPDIKLCYAIPLSATGKNPFFDRPIHK